MKLAATVRRTAIGLVLLGSGLLAAAEVKYEVERSKVDHGNADAFSKPAVVKSLTVFQGIKAYKTIQDENITPDSARYFLLLKEANEVFKNGLAQVAKDESLDLV